MAEDSCSLRKSPEMYLRIADPPIDLIQKYHQSQRELYFKTAEWIGGVVISKLVLWFLEKMMKEQGIPEGHVKEIRVMRFPPKESHSKHRKQRVLYGVYSPGKCQISIYPFPLPIGPEDPLPRDLLLPDPELFKEEVIKTLIEETLHARYRSKYLKALEDPSNPEVKHRMNKIHKTIKKQADRYYREFRGWLSLSQGSAKRSANTSETSDQNSK